MSEIHCLKTWPEFYQMVVSGNKDFEVRKPDRDYSVGDLLVLQEYNPETGMYTKEMTAQLVTQIFDLRPLWDAVVMKISPYPTAGQFAALEAEAPESNCGTSAEDPA